MTPTPLIRVPRVDGKPLSTWLIASLAFLLVASIGCKRKPPPKRPKPAPPKIRRVRMDLPKGVRLFPEEVVIKVNKPFKIGSKESEPHRKADEGPRTTVTLKRAFTMWRYEVTQDEYKKKMGYNPSRFPDCGKKCPADQVSWNHAAFFCNQLSRERGFPTCFRCRGKGRFATCQVDPSYSGWKYYRCTGFRLPTEAEWEYAARAGETGPLYQPKGKKKHVLDATIDRIAWYSYNSQVTYRKGFSCSGKNNDKYKRCGPKPVGTKAPNAFGLYDMLGSVSEWVYDRYGPYPGYPVTDPVGATTGQRVFRGCSWFDPPEVCRLARRQSGSPALNTFLMGFRPARSLFYLKDEALIRKIEQERLKKLQQRKKRKRK